MNCPPCETKRICDDIKRIIADLKEVAFNYQKEELEHYENEIDALLQLIDLTKEVSFNTRNEIRLIGEIIINMGDFINDFYQNKKN